MDYRTQKLGYKIRKAIRYVQLYGLRRTLIKVDSYKHEVNQTKEKVQKKKAGSIAVIGCGKYSYAVIAYYIKDKSSIRSCFDINEYRSNSFAQKYDCYPEVSFDNILEDPEISLIFIASNHASHSEYAIQALQRGIAVHIEKPQVVNYSQYIELKEYFVHPYRINFGYNRPGSKLGTFLLQSLERENGPLSISWFIAGHAIDRDHWYFDDDEGGRVLGNLCHWIDFSLKMLLLNSPNKISIQGIRHEEDDENVILTFISNCKSIVSINFSAKGHTFEGVREKLEVHRGNLLASLYDFKEVQLHRLDKRIRKKQLFRDHGHERNINKSLNLLNLEEKIDYEYLDLTTRVMLASKESIDSGIVQTIYINEPNHTKLK